MASSLVVVTDTCAIFPQTLRDVLLRAAEAGLYRLRWSEEILDELGRNLREERGLTEDQTRHLLTELRRAFPEATVTGYERLVGSLTNDPKDRHVLAAAVQAGAHMIVTDSLKDFPDEALAPFDVEAQTPDDFLVYLFDRYPDDMAHIAIDVNAARRRPPEPLPATLDRLAKSAARFVGRLREHPSVAPRLERALTQERPREVVGPGEDLSPQSLDPGQLGLGDMDPEAFREHARRVVDWVATYLTEVDSYPVLSRVAPGEIRTWLPEAPPARGEPMEAILGDFARLIVPGITHWNHPAFFGYFGITGSGPGILGELLSAALNVNAMLWRTSPSATELEEVATDWLRQLLGLPAGFRGVIDDTASSSSLLALAAAREAMKELEIRQRGLAGRGDVPRLRLYCSEQAHSSIDKAAIVLGIGQESLRKIPTDGAFRLDVAALDAAIREDRAAGWRPFAVVAVVGTTATTSVDPVPAIADVCEREGLWLHVDAAYAGIAAIVPELRWALAGCDRADSLVVNPHKWLFTPIDCSVLFTRRPETLRAAFSLVPDFLQTPEDARVRNLMDYGVALGRRFRALKLWFVLRYFGEEGIVARLREHVRLAYLLADWIAASPDFELVAPVPFSTVNFRYRPASAGTAGDPTVDARLDRLNERLEEAVNATGRAFITHARVGGKYALHAAVGNLRTTEEHVARLWSLLRELAPTCQSA